MAFTDDAPVQLLNKKKRLKYKNIRSTVDGIMFDSRKELKRWVLLKELEKQGHIANLKRQVAMNIVVNKVKVCKWVADFVYKENNNIVYEDVKSKFTRKLPIYRIKKKLMLACFGVTIKEYVDG